MKHTFFTGLQIHSAEPIDERLYIEDLTTQELLRVFGLDGSYGYAKSVLFNKAINRFMYLTTYSSKADVINIANWSIVAENITEFPAYNSATSYGIGSCIAFEDAYNIMNFYIGLDTIGVAEDPTANPEKWFNLTKAFVATIPTQVEYRRINPTIGGEDTKYLFVIANGDVSNNGAKIPNIQIFIDTNARNGQGGIVWSECLPTVVHYSQSYQIHFDIVFEGSVSSLYYEAGNPAQMNVKIILN